MNSGVYRILNRENGQSYIGSTVNFDRRWKQHLILLRKGRHHSAALQRAWEKYGEIAFAFERLIVCQSSRDDLLLYEGLAFKAFPHEDRYNVCTRPGSRLGVGHNAEARKKISEAGMGRRHTLGKKLNSGPKLSIALKGRPKPPRTPEHIAAIAAAKDTDQYRSRIKAALLGNTNCAGRKLSPEHIAKLQAGRAAMRAAKRAN